MEQFNTLDLIPVAKLMSPEYRFYIPSYQRGYRWGAEQVRQLIEDLDEFFNYHFKKDDKKFYCLQPLVVKNVSIENETNQPEDVLEVIDGQQRLTTILLLLQVIHLLKFKFLGISPENVTACPDVYSIQYETRENSSVWMQQINSVVSDEEKYHSFDEKNCDYSHFAEVFKAAYEVMKDWKEDRLNDFAKVLRQGTKFIWYYPTAAAGTNADIFDRLNAGKIGLNNAELIKALFIQRGNWSDRELAYSKALSIEWNNFESRLQDKEFWGFIYRSGHPFSYDTHIEYIFDLLQDKRDIHRDDKVYTFNKYLTSYREMMMHGHMEQKERAVWVRDQWGKVRELMDTLNEWFNYKPVYHRIGFILEYVHSEDILSLKRKLDGKKHSERIKLLDNIIREEMSRINSCQLFYGKPQLSEVLFLYNVLLEDRRVSDKARFSFASYKKISTTKGWDQEHIASHTDYSPDLEKAQSLAKDIIELLLGDKPIEDNGHYQFPKIVFTPDEEEVKLCKMALCILNSDQSSSRQNVNITIPEEDTDIFKLYAAVQKHFGSDDDEFGTITLYNSKTSKEEKNFIWNFVLLNAATNRNYGNNIFPVKRRRILQDEYDVYTPVGTRNVFEKAYSRKSDQMLYWSKTDAKSYWEDLKAVLKPYVEFENPFKI